MSCKLLGTFSCRLLRSDSPVYEIGCLRMEYSGMEMLCQSMMVGTMSSKLTGTSMLFPELMLSGSKPGGEETIKG